MNENEKPQAWVFTFSVNSERLYNFVELFGKYDETRKEMYKLFGDKWAFQYPSRLAAGVERYGLEKLYVGSLTHMDSEHYRRNEDDNSIDK